MALGNGSIPDLLELWQEYCQGIQSPWLFKLWAGISMISGALERSVWTSYGMYTSFANQYIMLVGTPGVGKQVIDQVRDIWRDVPQLDSNLKALHIASDSITKASMIDELFESKQVKLPSEGPPLVYHSLLIASEEFGFLMPTFDPNFVKTLDRLWNSPDRHDEHRRTGIPKKIAIERPTLNLLAGTQPAYLATAFPEEAWSTGIGRRLMMIYCAEGVVLDIFQEYPRSQRLRQAVISRLSALCSLQGICRWESSAAERVREWHLAGGPPQPKHSRLVHYVRSRTQILVKLCMVSMAARGAEQVVSLADVERALSWQLEAERYMPDVFRAMTGRSDASLIDELHAYSMALYIKDRQKAIRGPLLREFLLLRMPHDKVEGLLGLAERANIIARVDVASDLWVPKARQGRIE